MKVETLLPLGKVDPGLRAPATPLDLASVADEVRLVESLGYDGLVVEETKEDPYVVSAIAAQATSRLAVGTAVAMAFPRSPTVTALSAWTLQRLSAGRFTLGLGTQVRGHVERRYGMRWASPAAWMRETVEAIRAVWRCWQTGEPLAHRGERFRLDLMVPLFDPGPIAHPAIPIHLAAVNPGLCEVAGAVADGIRPHPVCTPKYVEEVMLPAIRCGAERSARSLEGFSLEMKFLFATAPDRKALAREVENVRARVAFYASTPAYRPAFEIHGLGDLADRLKILSREQRWEEMPAFISDEVLETFAVVGPHDEIADRIVDRYGGVASGVEFSIAAKTEANRRTLADIVTRLRAARAPATLERVLVGDAPGETQESRRRNGCP